MSNLPPACLRQQELIADVQGHLIRLSELARFTSAAVAAGNENTVAELDRQFEEEVGEKERAMGALREHRKMHGC
jgi:hypothetical protein